MAKLLRSKYQEATFDQSVTKLGILSDTHNELERTKDAVRLLCAEGAEHLVHCGDLSSPEIVAVCAVLPFSFVLGNHDSDMVPHLQQEAARTGAHCLGWGSTILLSGKKIAVTHGHMTKDVRDLLAVQPDYLLTGHSHLTHDWRDGSVHRINPGALFRADTWTVALLDLETDSVRFLHVGTEA